jgi:hypothetical protein
VRLVVTLLESVGSILSSGGLLRARLDRYLVYLQRYLFLKELLPIDLQFAVADLFKKLLRPGQTRLSSLDECTARIREIEAGQAGSTDRLVSLTAAATAEEVADTAGDAATIDEEDEEDEGDEEEDGGGEGRRRTRDGAQSLLDAAAAGLAEEGGDEDGDEDGEDEEDEEDDAGEEDEEDDEDDSDSDSDDDVQEWERSGGGVDGGGSRRAQEEDAFQAELDRMMADAVESAKLQPRTHQMATVEALTAGLDGGGASRARGNPMAISGHSIDGEEAVGFRFLSRAGAKRAAAPQARALFVPRDSDMAVSVETHAAMAIREREEQKRLTLRGIERTQREALEEERMGAREQAQKDRRDGVEQNFSHRNVNPGERGGGGGGGGGASNSLARVGASLGAKAGNENSRDLSLKVESFAFASEETLTSSRVTLQGDSRRRK